MTLEEVTQRARSDSPTAIIADADLDLARSRVGSAVSLMLPRVSLSERQTYRHNNPEKYSFSLDGSATCEPSSTEPCIPLAVVDGQVTLPDSFLSNSFGLSAVESLSASTMVGVAQQKKAAELTETKVGGDEERLIQELLSAYSDLQYQVGLIAIQQRSIVIATELETAVRGSLTAGTATQLDHDRAALDLEEAVTKLSQLERRMPTYLASYAHTAGLDALSVVRICPLLASPDRGEEGSIEASTQLEALRLQQELDRLSQLSARLTFLPSLNVLGGLSYTGSGEDMDTVRAGMYTYDNWYVAGIASWTLFDGLGRMHRNRSADVSLLKSTVELADTTASLRLQDQQFALQLSDLAEDHALAVRSVALAERNVDAVWSMFVDGGQVTFDAVVTARKLLEGERRRQLSVERQRQQVMIARWLSGGRMSQLLGHVFEEESAFEAAGQCIESRP